MARFLARLSRYSPSTHCASELVAHEFCRHGQSRFCAHSVVGTHPGERRGASERSRRVTVPRRPMNTAEIRPLRTPMPDRPGRLASRKSLPSRSTRSGCRVPGSTTKPWSCRVAACSIESARLPDSVLNQSSIWTLDSTAIRPVPWTTYAGAANDSCHREARRITCGPQSAAALPGESCSRVGSE